MEDLVWIGLGAVALYVGLLLVYNSQLTAANNSCRVNGIIPPSGCPAANTVAQNWAWLPMPPTISL